MKRKIMLISIVALLANVSLAQEDKTVTLTVSGQGITQDEANQNALRNAIEQAFGTFVSSNTEILNDELVKDEIVSVSNGNIQKFEILSEVQMENGEWSATLKAVVSITDLTSFCESKGISVEFKGGLFAFNVNQQILNEKNEVKAIEDVCQIIRNIADVAFDFTITASDPISLDASNSNWRIPMYISVYKNINFDKIPQILQSTLKGLTLTKEEAVNYVKLGKKVWPISININEKDYIYILLRSDTSISIIAEMLYYFNHALQNFKVSNSIAEFRLKDVPNNIKGIDDEGFRIFLRVDHMARYYSASVFLPKAKAGALRAPKVFAGKYIIPKYILSHEEWGTNDKTSFQTVLKKKRINSNFGFFIRHGEQFGFVKKLKLLEGELIHNKPYGGKEMRKGLMTGLVISFSELKEFGKEIVRFYYDDIRDLNQISKISEYQVFPIKN